MLDQLTVSEFSGLLRSNFPVILGSGEVVDLELIEVKAIGEGRRLDSRGTGQTSFSLIFQGPTDRPLLQGIHQFEHPVLGTLAMFIVPIGPASDATGLCYQAIFN
jgi:hypothetical protein